MVNKEHQEVLEFEVTFSEKPTIMGMIEMVLKNPEMWFEQIIKGKTTRIVWIFVFISVICNFAYGLIVGSFSGNIQWVAAPIKIISGTIISVLLCYPSCYIFACLAGAKIDPRKTMALLISGMSLTAILLIGFAPVAFVFTYAINSMFFMGMIHFIAWGISMYFGIRHIYSGLTRMSCKETWLIKAWGFILIITMMQMSVTLRPIIGESDFFLTSEKRFFVEHWVGNMSSQSGN